MQILGTSQRVLFERHYPFEHRYLTYVYQMSRQIQAPVVTDENWNNNLLFQGRKSYVGCLPYVKTDMLDRESLAEGALVKLWEAFSLEMREKAGFTPEQSCFYAEKIPHKAADVIGRVLQGRTIYLLRDPRDEMVSIKSFNQKRGFQAFGWQEDDTDISYARKMCKNRRDFMRGLLETETSHKRYHVRYEDLIREGESETDRLAQWLGASLNYGSATKNKDIQQQHMTSQNSLSSVERWRKELSDDVQSIFSEELGTELVELGYAVG